MIVSRVQLQKIIQKQEAVIICCIKMYNFVVLSQYWIIDLLFYDARSILYRSQTLNCDKYKARKSHCRILQTAGQWKELGRYLICPLLLEGHVDLLHINQNANVRLARRYIIKNVHNKFVRMAEYKSIYIFLETIKTLRFYFINKLIVY